MTQIEFGAGVLWGTPLLNPDGTVPSNPTPTKFGILQEVQADIQFQTKGLYGGNQFPFAIGRGQGKITANAKAAQIIGAQWAQLFFGKPYNLGNTNMLLDYNDSTGAPIPATPYQITPTVPGSGTWKADLGVIGSDGNPYTLVTGTPTTGQYEVAAGVYTFAAADTGKTVFINYQYEPGTGVASSAGQFTLTNDLMGYSPIFSVDLMLTYYGKQLTMHLYQVTSSKLALPTKLDDFTITQFDMEAFSDSQNRVASFSFSGG